MFICTPCLRMRFTNGPRSAQSMGLCEFCMKMRSCSDIPTGQLDANPDYIPPGLAMSETTANGLTNKNGMSITLKDGRVFKRTVTKRGIVGFAQGVALVDGLPVLRPSLAGKCVKVTIEVFDE